MKKSLLLTILFVSIFSIKSHGKNDVTLKDSDMSASYVREMTLQCSQIIKKGYSGNLSEGSYIVFFETFDGNKFQKVFTAPQPLQQASLFVKDLENCKQLTLSYDTKDFRSYYFSSFSIEF
ncbi:MAG: hypothetical protein HYS98_07390 [Deltaproteobacteria bacterium]|nr:hypothetical protein [Deltaproteobacteria bacterium]